MATCEAAPPNCGELWKGMSAAERTAVYTRLAEPMAVMAFNLRGDANIGMMMRTACLFGAAHFYTVGRKPWDRRYSVGAHHYIPVSHLPGIWRIRIDHRHSPECECGVCKTVDVAALISFCREAAYTPVFVEQGGGDVSDPVWARTIERPLFIFGNESVGIDLGLIREVRAAIPATAWVAIPQGGIMRSHNVAIAASIVLWEYVRGRSDKTKKNLGIV